MARKRNKAAKVAACQANQILLFVALSLLASPTQGATDAASSTITGIGDTSAFAVNQVTVQAEDENGNWQSSGGDSFTLIVEQLCLWDETNCNLESTQDSVAGLPISVPMTDVGDGTYTANYSVIAPGTVTVSVDLQNYGILGEYWFGASRSGSPHSTQADSNIDFNWGNGSISPLWWWDNVGVRWTGNLCPTTTESYEFWLTSDDGSRLTMEGQTEVYSSWWNLSLTAGTKYPFELTYEEDTGQAFVKLEWSSPSITRETIPASAFCGDSEKVGVTPVQEIEIFPTSVPSQSTVIDGLSSITVGETYTVTMQSKDVSGADISKSTDTYTVDFSDGGTNNFSTTAIHQGNGLYSAASLQPTIAGDYTVTIKMTNDYTATDASIPTQISGSPISVKVYPVLVSPANSYIISSSLNDGLAEVSQTITVQLVDINDNPITVGLNDIDVYLKVEQVCDSVDNLCCGVTASSDDVPGLPITTLMTPRSDGQFEGSFMITAGSGTVFVSAEVVGVGGIHGSYRTGSDTSVAADICQTDPAIDFDWGTGNMTPLSVHDGSVVWTGYISPPASETYTFSIQKESQATLDLDGTTLDDAGYTEIVMERGVLYPLDFELTEVGGSASLELYWKSLPSLSQEVVPTTAFLSQQRVGGTVHEVEIFPTSVPVQSAAIDGLSSVLAGDTYTVTIQSRNAAGVNHDVDDDTYTVDFSEDGGTNNFSTTATHSVDGLYSGSFEPTIAGDYTVTIDLTNDYTDTDASIPTQISGSPISVIVYPGEADAAQCYYNSPVTATELVAGSSLDIVVQYVDHFGNLHYDTTMSDELSNGMIITVEATYLNHNDWLSPIGVADDPSWQASYSTTVINDNLDGTTTSSLTMNRAGEFLLSVLHDGNDILESPNAQNLKVKPDTLYGPACALHDVQIEIYAGFSYMFLIQGRDQYKNNVFDLLSDTFGIGEYSVQYVNQDDRDLVVDATIVDDEVYPGVYAVSLELPKLLSSASYDLEITMGGLLVDDTPTIEIKPCSNFIALDREMVIESGQKVTLDSLDYTIGEELQTIGLPQVEIYCDQEPTVQLVQAKRLTQTGQKFLTEGQLATFGITLQPSDQTLQVYTETNTMEDAFIELELKLTVIEEEAWADTAYVRINIFKLPTVATFEPVETVEIEQSALYLDSDSVTDKTLQMTKDEDGNHFLSPVVLDCSTEWSKALPQVYGESDENKFDVTVNLDQASKFLSYSVMDREFKLQATVQKDKSPQQFYTVTVNLIGNGGKISQYTLPVSFICGFDETTEKDNVFEGASRFVYRYDESPPTPHIHSVDSFGEVIIRFNETMVPMASLRETEIGRTGRRLAADLDRLEVKGRASQTFQNFSRIHNSTFAMEDDVFPSLKVAILPADEESQCAKMLDFVWECVDFKADEMIFKLVFTTPECVSNSDHLGDLLVITLYDQRLFEDSSGKLIWPETRLEKRIHRQIASAGAEKETLEAIASSASTAIVTTSLINVILNFLLQGSLSTLVSALKNLQIIVHVMLIQIFLVAHAEIFIQELQKLIAFEIYDITEIAQTLFGSVANPALDIHFESVGYETSDAIINSGLISIILFTAPLILLASYLASKFCCCARGKSCFKSQLEKTLFNRVIIFVDGSFLIMGVCCTVNIYQVRTGVASKNTSYYFSVIAISAYIPYFFSLLGYLLCKFSELDQQRHKSRVGTFYQHLDLRGAGRITLVFTLLEYARRTAICFVITFGRSSVTQQLLLTQFNTLFILCFIGIVKPFKGKRGNRLAMWNEYTILLIYCLCLTQTDFVDNVRGRKVMGWSLIGLISLNIVINFGSMITSDLKKTIKRLKYHFIRKKQYKEMAVERERRAKIDAYRKNILGDLLSRPSTPIVDQKVPSMKSLATAEGGKIEMKIKKNAAADMKLSTAKLQYPLKLVYYNKSSVEEECNRENNGPVEEQKEENPGATQEFKLHDFGWNHTHDFLNQMLPPVEMSTQEKLASMRRTLNMTKATTTMTANSMLTSNKLSHLHSRLAHK